MSAAVVAATALAMVAITGDVARAGTVTTPEPAVAAQPSEVWINSEPSDIVKALTPYVKSSAAGWTIEAPASVLATIPSETLVGITAHIEEANQLIREGKLVVQPDGSAVVGRTGSSSPGVLSVSPSESKIEEIWRGSHGSVRDHWWGWEFRMDNWAFNQIKNMLHAGAAVGAVAAAIAAFVGAASAPVLAIMIPVALAMIAIWAICERPNGSAWYYLWTVSGLPYPGACRPF